MVCDPVCSRTVDAYQVKTTNNEFELFGAEMKLVGGTGGLKPPASRTL